MTQSELTTKGILMSMSGRSMREEMKGQTLEWCAERVMEELKRTRTELRETQAIVKRQCVKNELVDAAIEMQRAIKAFTEMQVQED